MRASTVLLQLFGQISIPVICRPSTAKIAEERRLTTAGSARKKSVRWGVASIWDSISLTCTRRNLDSGSRRERCMLNNNIKKSQIAMFLFLTRAPMTAEARSRDSDSSSLLWYCQMSAKALWSKWKTWYQHTFACSGQQRQQYWPALRNWEPAYIHRRHYWPHRPTLPVKERENSKMWWQPDIRCVIFGLSNCVWQKKYVGESTRIPTSQTDLQNKWGR